MKIEIRNGKTVVINETQGEAIQTLNDIIEEYHKPPVTAQQSTTDWGIKGGETNAELYEWVREYISDCESDAAEPLDLGYYENLQDYEQ